MAATTYEKKTVPNQKVVTVDKQPTKDKLHAQINMEALNAAALDLDAGAFKLWIYFSKNQNGYEFALSSKAVEETFGIKIKQYNNAIATLTEKGYLVMTKGNKYVFNEIPVMTKGNKDVITKSNKDVMTKSNNSLLPKDIRNITSITSNNTFNNTVSPFDKGVGGAPQTPNQKPSEKGFVF